MDIVNLQRLAEIRQQEYLQTAENERNAVPLRTTIAEAANKLIARLTATNATTPARTAPDLTEACVDC